MSDYQNSWVSGFCPSSGILKTRKHDVSNTAPAGEGRETPTLLGHLQLSSFQNVLFSSFLFPDNGQGPETR
jgi:hypothetical protein